MTTENNTIAVNYIDAIVAPSEMLNKLVDFSQLVKLARLQNNVPNYCKDGEESFRYIVAFKQCYNVRTKTYFERPTGQSRKVVKNLRLIETVASLSKASENDENIIPLKDEKGNEIKDEKGRTMYETKTEFRFVGWKEIRTVKATTEQATEKILTIVFDAAKGISIKNILLYAIDTLAKKEEVANINGRTILRQSCELHAFIPYKGETVNTMTTGGGVPARFLRKDLSKFVDLFMRKLDRAQNKSFEVLPAIHAKLESKKEGTK